MQPKKTLTLSNPRTKCTKTIPPKSSALLASTSMVL